LFKSVASIQSWRTIALRKRFGVAAMARIGRTYPRHEVPGESGLPGGPERMFFAATARARALETLWLLTILASVLFFWPWG
jgi:hypothetical protein